MSTNINTYQLASTIIYLPQIFGAGPVALPRAFVQIYFRLTIDIFGKHPIVCGGLELKNEHTHVLCEPPQGGSEEARSPQFFSRPIVCEKDIRHCIRVQHALRRVRRG